MPYSHVFWDWNGTLLDDVIHSVACFNQLLIARGLSHVVGLDIYREHFSFPVQDYYRYVGFDLERESFDDLARQYINLYHAPDALWSLHEDAEMALQWMAKRKFRQVILTASQRNHLDAQLANFAIRPYFESLLALDDIYARGKIAIGQTYLEQNKVERGLMIGDTVHDYEVANLLALDCLLVARGHNSYQTLLKCGAPVFYDLHELCAYLENK